MTEQEIIADHTAELPVAQNPLVVIQRALDLKLPAAELKEYFDLYRQIQAATAEQAYAEDMARCQAGMPRLPRKKKGNRGSYCPYDEVDRIIRPIYTEHGFSLSFTEDPTKSTVDSFWYRCTCRHRAGHKEITEGLFPRDGEGSHGKQMDMTALQAVGSNHSYGKRYLAKDVFALAEEDEDTDGASGVPRITDEEAKELESLIRANGVNYTHFFTWATEAAGFQVKCLEELPARLMRIARWTAKKLRPENGGHA